MPHQSYIERVFIEVVPDEDPDLSYLEQDYRDAPPAERERYQEQDRERLAAYREGEWSMAGVRLAAEITYDREGYIDSPLELRSAGVWGIESDSGRAYFVETARSQDDDLRGQLEALRFSKEEIDHALSGTLELQDGVGIAEPRPDLSSVNAAVPAPSADAGPSHSL